MTGIIIFFVVCYVAGILSLLYGRKMINAMLAIYAFMVTYQFVLTHFENNQYVLWFAVLAGVVAVLLVKFAKNLAFFLIGAVIGILVACAVLPFLPAHPDWVTYVFVAAVAIGAGILCKHFSDTFIRYGTAYAGGSMLATSTLFLIMNSGTIAGYASAEFNSALTSLTDTMYGSFTTQYSLWILAISIVLMFLGAAYQKKH